MKLKRNLLVFIIIGLLIVNTTAGPISGAICSAGCASLVCACYAAAGFTFGTVTAGAGTPAVIVTCNLAFGKCMAACAAATITPVP
jgi:hypothetical protein